ncbi:hypothetical protein Clacol_007505 [Clathrus columnatus]|uniref:C2H2-type domain-containing protein n=1 Tax=Clathrus columnatus TaxID=1419009 RepID=A0AAV5AKN2_9AGAM|nr:hypothetical protein Clacol_007505 [Clathrus columnatus]
MPPRSQRSHSQVFPHSRLGEYTNPQQIYYQESRNGQTFDYFPTLHPNQDSFDDSDSVINWTSVPRSSHSATNSPEISRPFTPAHDNFASQNSPYIRTPSSSFSNHSPISISATVEKLNSTFPIPLPTSYYTIPNPQSSPLSHTFLPDSPYTSDPVPLPGQVDNVVMSSVANTDPSWQFNGMPSSIQQSTWIQSDQVWPDPYHVSSPSTIFDPSAIKVEQTTPERHSMPLAMSPTLLMLTPGLANSQPGNEPIIKEEHTMPPHFEMPSPHYDEFCDNYTSVNDPSQPANYIDPPFPSISQPTPSPIPVPSRSTSGRRSSTRNSVASPRGVDWNIQKKSRGRHVPTIKSVYGTLENAIEVVDAMSAAGVKSDRPYLCVCGLCFQRNEHLKRHQNSIHSNFKPFACPAKDCNKSFSRRDNLFQHLHVHRKEDIPVGYQLPNARKRSPT